MKSIIKKIIAFLWLSFMLLLAMATANASGIHIKTGSKTIIIGTGVETVEIPVQISGNTGITGMTLKIEYAEELCLTGVASGSALGSLTLTKTGGTNLNPLILLWDGLTADSVNGTIATLTFEVPKDTEKSYSISVIANDTFDNELNPVNVTTSNSTIAVKSESSPVVSITAFTSDKYNTNSLLNITTENAPKDAKLYIAAYDAFGRLLEFQAPALTNNSASAIFSNTGVEKFRAFVWQDNLSPLSKIKDLPSSD